MRSGSRAKAACLTAASRYTEGRGRCAGDSADTMPLIRLGARSLDNYAEAVGPNVIATLRRQARAVAGRRILHLSAGPYGGAVAETLGALVPLQRDLGLEVDWHLLRGDAPRVWLALYEG